MSVTISARVTQTPDMDKFDSKTYVKKVIDVMTSKSIPEVVALFQKTVDGWDNPPDFTVEGPDENGMTIRAIIYPSGDNANVWGIVNYGSPAHTIEAKNGAMLVFQPGYVAATRPGLLTSKAKQRSGNAVFMRYVQHPGFEARNFLDVMKKTYDPIFSADMQAALKP